MRALRLFLSDRDIITTLIEWLVWNAGARNRGDPSVPDVDGGSVGMGGHSKSDDMEEWRTTS